VKKIAIILLAFIAAGVSAQDFSPYSSEHFIIYTDKMEPEKQLLAESLERFYDLVDEYLTFPSETAPLPFSVYDFSTLEDFKNHLIQSSLPDTYSPPLYLHFDTPGYRRLIGVDLIKNWSMVKQKLTVQLIRGHFGAAPLWLQEGYSLYLSAESNRWLPSVKEMVTQGNVYPVLQNTDLSAGLSRNSRIQSLAWVNFLINSPDAYHNRRIWNAWHLVEQNQDRETNTDRIHSKLFAQYQSQNKWEEDINQFYKTIPLYSEELEKLKLEIGQKSDSVLPLLEEIKETFPDELDYSFYYYAGLYHYNNRNWQESIDSYQKSIALGSPSGLSEYGLILALYMNNQEDQAQELWKKALDQSLDQYRPNLEQLSRFFN